MKEEFSTSARRWYDKDPVLSSAMKTLEESDDETQIKVALNLIKIIKNHCYEKVILFNEHINAIILSIM